MDYAESMLPAAVPFATFGERTTFAKNNEGVTPVFFVSTVQNKAKSEAEGRPIFDEVEFCRILIAGDNMNAHVEPVSAAILERFPAEYQHYKATNEKRAAISGTPLKQWPLITPVKIAEFEALNIFNVEGLANVAEVHLSKAFDLREWREKAKAWLAQAKDGAAAAQYAAENERLRGDLAVLREQIAAMSEQVSSLLKEREREQRRRA